MLDLYFRYAIIIMSRDEKFGLNNPFGTTLKSLEDA